MLIRPGALLLNICNLKPMHNTLRNLPKEGLYSLDSAFIPLDFPASDESDFQDFQLFFLTFPLVSLTVCCFSHHYNSYKIWLFF